MVLTCTFSSTNFLSLFAKGQGNSRDPGLPLNMHEARTILSAPLFFISTALAYTCLPGHPPQLLTPITSTGPVSEKPPSPLAANERHVVAGQYISVCWHLIMPTFM